MEQIAIFYYNGIKYENRIHGEIIWDGIDGILHENWKGLSNIKYGEALEELNYLSDHLNGTIHKCSYNPSDRMYEIEIDDESGEWEEFFNKTEEED
ncbi:MAG: hypothetical protein HQ565_13165 [Bacteroidetes bacterium]|nr:hypothetical protein [Bacteroidota bacterium]